jgi:hypothetical protein
VCCVDSAGDRKGAIIVSPPQGATDGPTQPYPTPPRDGRGSHGALLPHRRRLRPAQPPRRSTLRVHKAPLGLGEVITLAIFQQLRGVESERSFLRDAQRFFSHLFPGVVGLHPSSFHRRVRKLRRFLEPLRREVLFRDGRGPRDVARRLDAAFGLAPLLRFLRARASLGRRG